MWSLFGINYAWDNKKTKQKKKISLSLNQSPVFSES